MSTRSFIIVLIVVGLVVAAAFLMHMPAGSGPLQSMPGLHGSN